MKAKPTTPGVEVGGISARKLEGLARKIAALKRDDYSEVRKLVVRAGVAYKDIELVLWHIAAQGLAPVAGGLLSALERVPKDLTFDQVEAVFRRIDAPTRMRSNWLEGVMRLADCARSLDAERVPALAASLPDSVRAAFTFTQTEKPTDEARASAIAQLRSPSGALAFAVELRSSFLVHVTFDELRWAVADDPRACGMLPSLLVQRADSADALLELAADLGRRNLPHVQAAAMAVAMQRMAARGQPIPEGLEQQVLWTVAPAKTTGERALQLHTLLKLQPVLALGLEALSEARAHALAARGDLWRKLLVLGAHPSAVMLASCIAEHAETPLMGGYFDPLTLLGSKHLEATFDVLLGLLDTHPSPSAIRAIATALMLRVRESQARVGLIGFEDAVAWAAHAPLEWDARFDRLIIIDLASWGSGGLELVLQALPPARRDALALRLAATPGEPVDRLLTLAHLFSPAASAGLLRAVLQHPTRVSSWYYVSSSRDAYKAVLADTVAAFEAEGGVVSPEARLALGLDVLPPPEATLVRAAQAGTSTP